VSYFANDHQGSTALVTDASGGQVSYTRYYPYGRTRTQAGTPPTDKLYTGQQRETAGGVYHYKARMYNADTGRFPQADTVVRDATEPRALNRYAYAYNSPAVYTDPTGHFSFVGPWLMPQESAIALLAGSPWLPLPDLHAPTSTSRPCSEEFSYLACCFQGGQMYWCGTYTPGDAGFLSFPNIGGVLNYLINQAEDLYEALIDSGLLNELVLYLDCAGAIEMMVLGAQAAVLSPEPATKFGGVALIGMGYYGYKASCEPLYT
jgi:RHS repeat-associated protein